MALHAYASALSNPSKSRLCHPADVNGYAANAILLPSLDMLSNLTSEHAPAILSHVLTGRPKGSGMWDHWRGRYGLTEAQQGDVWASVDAGYGQAALDAVSKETVRLRFQTYDGEVREVDAELGRSLLEVGKANDLPSLEGVCGGNLGEYPAHG